MLEVTAENFSRVYPEIEESFHAAKLISIDTEFSALNPLGISNNRYNFVVAVNLKKYLI